MPNEDVCESDFSILINTLYVRRLPVHFHNSVSPCLGRCHINTPSMSEESTQHLRTKYQDLITAWEHGKISQQTLSRLPNLEEFLEEVYPDYYDNGNKYTKPEINRLVLDVLLTQPETFAEAVGGLKRNLWDGLDSTINYNTTRLEGGFSLIALKAFVRNYFPERFAEIRFQDKLRPVSELICAEMAAFRQQEHLHSGGSFSEYAQDNLQTESRDLDSHPMAGIEFPGAVSTRTSDSVFTDAPLFSQGFQQAPSASGYLNQPANQNFHHGYVNLGDLTIGSETGSSETPTDSGRRLHRGSSSSNYTGPVHPNQTPIYEELGVDMSEPYLRTAQSILGQDSIENAQSSTNLLPHIEPEYLNSIAPRMRERASTLPSSYLNSIRVGHRSSASEGFIATNSFPSNHGQNPYGLTSVNNPNGFRSTESLNTEAAYRRISVTRPAIVRGVQSQIQAVIDTRKHYDLTRLVHVLADLQLNRAGFVEILVAKGNLIREVTAQVQEAQMKISATKEDANCDAELEAERLVNEMFPSFPENQG